MCKEIYLRRCGVCLHARLSVNLPVDQPSYLSDGCTYVCRSIILRQSVYRSACMLESLPACTYINLSLRMSAYLFICIHVSVYAFADLYVCHLSVCVSFCQFVYLCLTVYLIISLLLVYLPVGLPAHFWLHIHVHILFVCMPIYPTFCLSVCLSACLCVKQTASRQIDRPTY